MLDVNLFSLYCFEVVSQVLNYTKAAEVLNISQPALSKNIRSLEHVLGYQLLERDTRNVQLTDAGIFFRQRIVKILDDIDQSVEDARGIAKGQEGVLKIGFLPYAFSDKLPIIIQEYKKRYPNVKVILQDGEENLIEERFKNGDYDIAFLTDWGTDLTDRFARKVLYQDSYYLAVSKKNSLSQKEYVTFEDMKEQNFLMLNQDDYSSFGETNNNRVLELCMNKGFFPNIIRANQAKTLIGLCVLIGSNEGIAILASHMIKFVQADNNIVFLPIRDVDIKFSALICYEKKIKNSCVKDFLHVVDLFIK